MSQPGGGAEREPGQPIIRVPRRTLLRNAAAIGAGVVATAIAAKASGITRRLIIPTTNQSFGVCTNDTQSSSGPEKAQHVVSSELLDVPERWVFPYQVTVNSSQGARSVDIRSNLVPVFTKENQRIGEVLEARVEVNPRDEQTTLEFKFQKNPQGNYHVLTSGWQSWSSSVAVGSQFADRLVGRRLYEEALGGQTVPFFEPGPGGEKIPDQEGRSYGWVGFRDVRMGFGRLGKSGENLVLGVIPGFDSLESIRFRQDRDGFIVSVNKNLEGALSRRNVTFRVFLGHANPHQEGVSKSNYADLMIAFSKELSKVVGNVPLMKDRVIGFSWSAYGSGVTQADVQKEIAAGQGIFDTYVIDDGWETVTGSLQVNQNKFPDLPGLAKQMKQAGIKPGIWVAPFKIKENGAGNLPKEWFMKDKDGRPMKLPLPQPLGTLENSFQFDVSNPEFRSYSIGKLVELAKIGFEVFKADFLATPFTDQLQNKAKTSVEYYRQYFEEFRKRVRETLGKEIEIIGCGAPMMESIGLFNGMRISPDSALGNMGGVFNYIPLRWVVERFNTGQYRDATAVSVRRTLLFRNIHGLILDGVHLADGDVPLNPDKRGRLNESMLAFNRLGIGNLFVGDSLARVGEVGRHKWREFIKTFKMGNVSLACGDRRKPKIPERFVLPKARLLRVED